MATVRQTGHGLAMMVKPGHGLNPKERRAARWRPVATRPCKDGCGTRPCCGGYGDPPLEQGVARALLGPVLACDCEPVYDRFCKRVWGPACSVYPLQGRGYSIQRPLRVPFPGHRKWHWSQPKVSAGDCLKGRLPVARALRATFPALLPGK